VSIQDKQRYMGEQAQPVVSPPGLVVMFRGKGHSGQRAVCPIPGQARSNYKNTIFATKRVIGRGFEEPEVQEEIARAPFTVVKVRPHLFHHPLGGLRTRLLTNNGALVLCVDRRARVGWAIR
jgi:hypothetical protein